MVYLFPKEDDLPTFFVAIGDGGRFRVDDVPPGRYDFRFDNVGDGSIRGSLRKVVTIPADRDAFDLGQLQLRKSFARVAMAMTPSRVWVSRAEVDGDPSRALVRS